MSIINKVHSKISHDLIPSQYPPPSIYVTLSSTPAVNITTPPMDMVVTSGDSFNLTCVAEGETPPTINWEHGNGVLVGNGQVVGNDLVFVEALPDHAGVYVCVARSGGDTARASANVTVNCECEEGGPRVLVGSG